MGLTPLHRASLRGDKKVARTVLEHGADVTTRDKNHGSTLLHQASSIGRLEVAEILLDYGADPTAQDEVGRRGSHASFSGSVSMQSPGL